MEIPDKEGKMIVRICKPVLFIAMCLFSVGALKADSMAFATVYGGGFGTLDLDSGAFTLLGNSGEIFGGLDALDGTLYGQSNHTGTLYTVDPTNGSVTSVGGSGPFNWFGGTTTGLYALGTDGNLYSINPSTGAGTLIGSTGGANNGAQGLSADAGSLYLNRVVSGEDLLYTLNTSTGAATLIGPTGLDDVLGAVFEDGTLFGDGQSQSGPAENVVTLNQITGTGTTGAAITPSGTSVIYLAPDPLTSVATPEPGSLGLSVILIAALASLGFARRFFGLKSMGAGD
jgi:hypothetical protein